jgi:O-antigen ligase
VLGGLALWGLLQSLPWPAPVLGVLSPRAVELWQTGAELQAASEAAEAGRPLPPAAGQEGAVRVLGASPSVAPAASRLATLHLLALAMLLLAAAAAAEERAARRLVLAGLLLAAFFQVLYGAGGWLAKSGTIWGRAVAGETGRLRGTFVNSDHFALYLGMATCAAGGWLWWSLRKVLRDRSWEQALLLLGPPLLAFLTCFVAVAFSGSRAGLLALVVGLSAQGLALALHYRKWQIFLATSGVVGLGLLGVVFFGFQQGFGRLLQTSVYEVTWNARLKVYAATFDLFLQFPLLGSGLGSFRSAFPLAQPPGLPATWEHAHNDYLELLATGGPLALAAALAGLVWLTRALWRTAHLGRRSEDRAAGLIALGALATAACHAFFDFGLSMPANAFTLTMVCGLALGVGHSTSGSGGKARSGLTVFLPAEVSSEPVGGWGQGRGQRDEMER